MEHTFNFLRPLTPEPSFNDLLNEFSLTQHGEGVLTRRQARLAETQRSAAESSNPGDTVLPPELGPSSEPEQPAQPQRNQFPEVANVDNARLADDNGDDVTLADDETAPYLKDTLVAQNDLLEAHVVKTHFRRMKNFS